MDKRQNALRRAMKVILPVLLVFIVILSILVLIHLAGPLNDTPLPLDENQSSLLSGQTWHLNFYWTGNATTPVIEKTDVVIAFSDDGRVSGLSGCNIYFGEYDLSGDTLQIHQIESTQMTSTSEVLNQEKIFFSLLLKTKKYTIENKNCLMLFDESGNPILSFTSQSQPLQGKEWNLWYPLNDTEESGFKPIKIQFLDDNQLKGIIGDRVYCGTYEQNPSRMLPDSSNRLS